MPQKPKLLDPSFFLLAYLRYTCKVVVDVHIHIICAAPPVSSSGSYHHIISYLLFDETNLERNPICTIPVGLWRYETTTAQGQTWSMKNGAKRKTLSHFPKPSNC